MRRIALAVLVLVTTGTAACTSPGTARSSAGGATGSPGPSAAAPATTATPPVHPPRLRVVQMPWRLPEPLAREAVVPGADGARVRVAGGLLAGDRSTSRAFALDLRSGARTPLPDLGTPVHDTAGATLAGRSMVLGGGNASEQSVVQVLGPQGSSVRGHLPGPRSDLSAVQWGGGVVVVGGYDGGAPALPDVLSSDDGRHWRTVARLPVPVRYAGVVATGPAVWVFGGERGGAMVDAVQRVDPSTGHARVVAHLPRRLGHASALLLGGRVLVAGGRTSADRPTSRLWWFDPASRRFSRAGRLPHPLADAASLGDGATVGYLVGGETPALSDRVLRLRLG